MKIKSLKDISWNVTEEQYRADAAFSYSLIASFFREGPKALIKTKKDDTPSLRGGSILDTLLTDTEEFDNKFYVSDTETPSELVLKVLNELWNTVDDKKLDLEHIPTKVKIDIMNKHSFYSYWKDPTRLAKLATDGYEYYRLMTQVLGKTIISSNEKKAAIASADALKQNRKTRRYFVRNPFNKDIELLYQLKFKCKLRGFDVRCMFDFIEVDHANKIITPGDLKTTGEPEEHFEHSFLKWSYFIQATLYMAILKEILSQDDYFKDFTIMPFRFVVVNKDNLSPIEWIVTEETIAALTKAKYPTVWELLEKIQWHVSNNIYNYSKDTVESDFTKPLSLKFLNKDE